MNRRLEERDRFTAIGARRLKRITDKVIEEVFGGGGRRKKKKGRSTPQNVTPSDKLVTVYLGLACYTRC